MDIKLYFQDIKGTGILCTADVSGKTNGAIYASPHFLDEKTIAFIMRDRLTRANINQNPSAHYLFLENTVGKKGIRLNLSKIEESADQEKISQLMRRPGPKNESGEKRYLVTFRIDKALSLLGGEEIQTQ